MPERIDLIDLIDAAYDFAIDREARHRVLVDAHQAYFGFPQGSFLAPFHLDRARGRLTFREAELTMTSVADPFREMVEGVQRSASTHPQLAELFYGSIQANTMSRRLADVPEAAPFFQSMVPVYAQLGVADFHVLCATNVDGHGLLLGSVLRKPVDIARAERRRLLAVATHLAASWRLGRALDAVDSEEGDAVLEPSGRVAHAAGDARSKSARARLRKAVIDRERAHTRAMRQDTDEALNAWPCLVSGRWTLLDRFDTDGRRYLVARENAPHVARFHALTQREQHVAARAAEGHTNKLIAYELGIGTGTVSSYLRTAMRKLGVRRRVQLASLHRLAADAEVTDVEVGGEALTVGSAPQRLPDVELTPAESEILAGLRRGDSTAAIAQQRGSSVSTVENQLAALYRKLGVSGRAELVARVG